MRALLLLAAVVGVTGCTFGVRICTSSGDCEGGGVCSEDGFCVAPSGLGGGGGATGGGGGAITGGGTGGGDNTCEDECPVGYLCENTVCLLKVTGVSITHPGEGAVFGPETPLVVRATLMAPPGVVLPQQLLLAVPAFGDAPTVMERQGGGEYVADAGLPTGGTGDSTVSVEVQFADAGLSATRGVVIDRIAPIVTLSVSDAPTRTASHVDGVMPEAYKRDEVAELRVISSKPIEYVAADFTYDDGGFPVTKIDCTSACVPDGGSCDCFVVELSVLPLNDFRYTYRPQVPAKRDAVGNMSNTPSHATLRVTRFGWKRDVSIGGGGPPVALHAPALSGNGIVYVGLEQSAVGGRLWAIAPGGEDVIDFDGGVEAVTSHAVVGQSLFWPSRGTAGSLNAIPLDGGVARIGSCGDVGYVFNSSMALANVHVGEERLIAISQGGALMSFRPSQTVGSRCADLGLAGGSGRFSVAVSPDTESPGVAYVASDFSSTLSRIEWSGSAWGASTSTTQHQLFTKALAQYGTRIAGGGGLDVGGVYSYPSDFSAGGGGLKFTLGTASDGGASEATGPAIDVGMSGPIFVYGNGSKLVQVAMGESEMGLPQAVDLASGTVVGVPAIGADGTRYVVTTSGYVLAVAADLRVLWSVRLADAGSVDFVQSSVALDTGRPTEGGSSLCGPGRLYVSARGDGSIYSIIVDSKGLKANALWPTFQHDNARTGNGSRVLSDWTCP